MASAGDVRLFGFVSKSFPKVLISCRKYRDNVSDREGKFFSVTTVGDKVTRTQPFEPSRGEKPRRIITNVA